MSGMMKNLAWTMPGVFPRTKLRVRAGSNEDGAAWRGVLLVY